MPFYVIEKKDIFHIEFHFSEFRKCNSYFCHWTEHHCSSVIAKSAIFYLDHRKSCCFFLCHCKSTMFRCCCFFCYPTKYHYFYKQKLHIFSNGLTLIRTNSTPLESCWPKPNTGNLQSPRLNSKKNHFFAWAAQLYSPFFRFYLYC